MRRPGGSPRSRPAARRRRCRRARSDPVQHDLVGGHVEADQGHDHLAHRRAAVGRRGDAREDAVDRALEAVAGDLELATALPEADQEAPSRPPRRPARTPPRTPPGAAARRCAGDELARERRVLVHRQRPLVEAESRSRSKGSSAPDASSSSNRSAASTASLRSASSRRSVVLSKVVTHADSPRGQASCACMSSCTAACDLDHLGGPFRKRPFRRRRRSRLARLVLGQPAVAVGAHVLDQRHQGRALVGEGVFDPGRDLGVGPALDYPLLLQRAQAQREGAGADAGEGALELAEAQRVVGEVADDQERPLAGDDLGRPADRATRIEHEPEDSGKALQSEALARARALLLRRLLGDTSSILVTLIR